VTTIQKPCGYTHMAEHLITSVGIEVKNVMEIGGSTHKNILFKNANRTMYDLASKPETRAYGFFVETSRPYDVVILRDVVEHVANPRELVNEALCYLHPRGVLYMEVPKEPSKGIGCEHLTQFTPQTLYALVGSHRVLRAMTVNTTRGAVFMVVAR
jgi:2-polyprenyl-3-methyl-5-hydroxy-6-metoxy-1,4-benzoquinol methylase